MSWIESETFEHYRIQERIKQIRKSIKLTEKSWIYNCGFGR